MKSKDYIKKNSDRVARMLADSIKPVSCREFLKTKWGLYSIVAGIVLVPVFIMLLFHGSPKTIALEDGALIKLTNSPLAIAASRRSIISVPSGQVNVNPFVPYRNISKDRMSDVPAFELVEPPEKLDSNSDAARVMDTIVSGILYDKYSPSAILNIEGNDYLVKKGDVINNYKVLNIMQNAVTVRLGKNVYTAGIGEILTEGNVNYNNVPNLSNRFGGVK